jgi:hypothetical protein
MQQLPPQEDINGIDILMVVLTSIGIISSFWILVGRWPFLPADIIANLCLAGGQFCLRGKKWYWYLLPTIFLIAGIGELLYFLGHYTY